MALEFSFGIVPLQKKGSQWIVLLVKHSSAGYWGFPKGHADSGELPRAAATRELKEETDLNIVRFLSESMFEQHYHYTLRGEHMEKTVGYFIAEVFGIVRIQKEEVSESQWLPIDQAIDALTYENDRRICRQAIPLLD